jgi:predicted HNH restriction endonuclease
MHVLIASDDDAKAVQKSVKSDGSISSWIVPKKAHIGDNCLLSHRGQGLFAKGVLLTEPQHNPSNTSRSVYCSDLGEIELLNPTVPHSMLAKSFRTWKWPTYPKSYTTVPEDIEVQLWKMVASPMRKQPTKIDESVSDEGAARLAVHLTRERDPKLIERKKRSVLAKKGKLTCEICSFNFEARYGELGANFCEVHHVKPLAHRSANEPTMLEELAIVCSNCHRMLHRRGLISIEELKDQLL